MRKITAGPFISLDGVVEAPQTWHFPYLNDEMGAAIGARSAGTDTLLLGRNTYETFAGAFANADGDPMAAELTAKSTVVVSNTLETADWKNTTILRGDPAKSVAELKSRPGEGIAVSGGTRLVQTLIRDGLLDEPHLLVHPIALGAGGRLFDDATGRRPMTLTGSSTLTTGVPHLTYQLG